MASSYGSDASKASLRSEYLDLCRGMPKAFSRRIDGSVQDMLFRLDLYREAALVLSYLPFHEEIDTYPIMRRALADGKRLALPWLDPRTSKLSFYEVSSVDDIKRGARGIAGPLDAEPDALGVSDLLGSLCLVPGLVFDGEGHRVGYGAGYYDEFLAHYPGDKVGLARSVQVSSNPLPHDDHDVAVDVLVTEGSIWRCRRL